MDDQTRRGYARLLWDLELFERSTYLQTSLEMAKESINELERLIVRLEQLENTYRGSKGMNPTDLSSSEKD